MKGFTKGKGAGRKFIPTTNNKKGLTKSDIQKHPHEDDRIGRTLPATRRKESLKEAKSKLKTFTINETFMYPDSGADFESHHIDTIEAKDFDEAQEKAMKIFNVKAGDVSSVGADLGDDTEGYEFDHIPHDGRTGEQISEKKAEKLQEEDEDLVSYVIHGFEIQEEKDDDDTRHKDSFEMSDNIYEKYLEKYGKDQKWRLGGGFGQALKNNDLPDAVSRADKENLERLSKLTGMSNTQLEKMVQDKYHGKREKTSLDAHPKASPDYSGKETKAKSLKDKERFVDRAIQRIDEENIPPNEAKSKLREYGFEPDVIREAIRIREKFS